MSAADQVKWDARYRAGAYAERAHPSALLAEWVGRLPQGRALDLACGAGRNSLFLARHGYEVTGVDISEVGLARARIAAERQGLNIRWVQHDLDERLPRLGQFNLICLFRYFDPQLIRRLPRLLMEDGLLMVEAHLATDQPVIGPSNPAFRAQPGELRRLLSDLVVRHQEEGVIREPDGRQAAVARLVGSVRTRKLGP